MVAGLIGRKNKNHMKKLSIAIAAIAVMISTGALAHQTTMSDLPMPPCTPACAVPIPAQLPN